MTSNDRSVHGLLAGLLIAVVGCVTPTTPPPVEPDPPPSPETISLATLNEEVLTLEEVMSAFLSSHMGHEALVQGEPAVRELTGRLVERRLFLAEAESLGLLTDERVVASVDAYRRRAAEKAFWKREVEDQVSVTDDEVEAFYAKTDVAVSISLIETEALETAEDLRGRVEAGGDFGEIAQAESTHESSSFGGAVTYVRRGDLDPALEEVVFQLEDPGALTPIVRTASGFVFARLDERTVNPLQPSREVGIPQIRGILEDRRTKELRREVEDRLFADAGVTIDDALLTREALLSETTPEAVVACAADATLTLGEFRDQLSLDAIRAASEEQVAKVAPDIVRQWAMELALAPALAGSGLLDDPEIARAADRFLQDTALAMLYQDYIYADLEITEEGAREYYESHREAKFTRPAEVRLAYIVVGTDEEAQVLLQRVEAGENFEDLAREVSIDRTSAAHGGRIGWIKEGEIVEEVEERVFAAEVGDLVGPVPTDMGLFVVRVMDRTDSAVVPFEVARGAVQRGLGTDLQRAAYAEWAEKLRVRAAIEMHAEGIQEAVVWLDEEAGRRAEEEEEADRRAEEEAAAAAAPIGPVVPGPVFPDEVEPSGAGGKP